MNTSSRSKVAFVGGGNMAGAVIGGLLKAGRDASSIIVVEPHGPARAALQQRWGVAALAAADATLEQAGLVVWAVKPQVFGEAAAPCAPHVGAALHLSVMAGIRSDALARAVGTDAVVRAMPNTPALIGQGISGLFARPAVTAAQRTEVEAVLASTGRTLWVAREEDLDAVTALSGSGPAYVFYLVESMMAAAERMGLPADQGRALALQTVVGAAALALQSDESPTVLRERVTSKGGTTHAALSSMQAAGVGPAIVDAILAAQQRARELGDEFGR